MPCAANDVHRVYRRVRDEWKGAMGELAFHRALEAVWKLLSEINGYVVTREPWKIRKEQGASPALHRILYSAAEGVRLAAVLLFPFMPATSRKIFETLGLSGKDPAPGDLRWGGLELGAALPESPALFPRVDAAAYLKGDSLEKMGTEKPETKSEAPGTAATPAASLAETPSDEKIGIEEFQKIRLVTAKIVAAERVPKSNRLMRLQVDLGTEQRQVVAGIAAKYSAEELVGRNVVVVANLKPAKLMGVESNGMVLAASLGEAGEPSLLAVAEDVPPGTRVK